MKTSPRNLVERIEAAPRLPPGSNERFDGYGVIGQPFRSGHVLALRRFPVSSVGPGYVSVWHRDSQGDWVFYATVPPRLACPRFFGKMASQAVETEITLSWTGPFRLRVAMPSVSFDWVVEAGESVATRIINTIERLLPGAVWRSPFAMAIMGRAAGTLLGAGRIGLIGKVPNGQYFIAHPNVLWKIRYSSARLAGEDFGPPGPLQKQARLGDFWIPQKGIFATGQSYFELFDPDRHSSAVSSMERQSTGTG